MPRIRTDRAQEEALNTVTTALNDLAVIDAITQEGWVGSVSIQFHSEGETRRGGTRVTIESSNKDFADVVRLMETRRGRLVKTIRTTVKKYGLILTEEEEALLEDRNRASKGIPPQTTKAASASEQGPDTGDFDDASDFS